MPTLFQAYGLTEPTPEATPAPEPSRTALGTAGDVGLSLLKGAIAVPEAAVGIADLVTGGRAGQAAEAIGLRPREAREMLDEAYSDPQREAFRRVQDADGFIGTAVEALRNPSVIGHSILESLPLMGAGGVVGRGVVAAAPRAGMAAGAIGEGTVAAGSAAEQIRQQSPDGRLTPEQAGLAGAAGMTTGLFGFGGAKFAQSTWGQKLGIADVDTWLAGAQKSPTIRAGLTRRVLGGAVSEGLIEELPQSISEQVLQNLATGKPLDEGVDQAAVLGLLSGAAMGGGFNAFRGGHAQAQPGPQNDAGAPIPPAGSDVPPPAPAEAGGILSPRGDPLAGNPGFDVNRTLVERGREADQDRRLDEGLDAAGFDARQRLQDELQGQRVWPVKQMERRLIEEAKPDLDTVDALMKAGSKSAADALKKSIDKKIAAKLSDMEVQALSSVDPRWGGKDFATLYMEKRKEGANQGDAAGHAATLAATLQLAKHAGMSDKAIAATYQKARGLDLDETPEFVERAMQGLADRGIGKPMQGIAQALAGYRDEAILAAGKALLMEQEPAAAATTATTVEAAPALASSAAAPQPATIDDGAHQGASSPTNGKTATKAQILAGNAPLGHFKLRGMPVSVENAAGSERVDLKNDPPKWRTPMDKGFHYGYFRLTEGADGDHVDGFFAEGLPEDYNGPVYVVDQVNPKTGRFDEHKAVVGPDNARDAAASYLAHYEPGWKGLGNISEFPSVDAFRAWVQDGRKKDKPLADLIDQAQAAAPAAVPAAVGAAEPDDAGAGGTTGAAGVPVERDGALTEPTNAAEADAAWEAAKASGDSRQLQQAAEWVRKFEKKPEAEPETEPVAAKPEPAQEPKATPRPDGTLKIEGDPNALKDQLKAAGVDRVMTAKDGVVVGKSQVDKAKKAIKPKESAKSGTAEEAPKAQPEPTKDDRTLRDMLAEAGTKGFWLGRLVRKSDGAGFDVKVVEWPSPTRADWGYELWADGKKADAIPFPAIRNNPTVTKLADLLLDYMNADEAGAFSMDQIGVKHAARLEQRAGTEQRKAEGEQRKANAEMAAMRKFRGDPQERAWDDTDLADYRRLRKLQEARFKTAGDEKMIGLLEQRIKGRPDKWKVGDGASYKVAGAGAMQTNRGFRIVALEPETKMATLRSVADTGLTSSGGNSDRIADVNLPVGELSRDRKYDAPAPAAESQPPAPEAAQTAQAPGQPNMEIVGRIRGYWSDKMIPALRRYFAAFDAFGVERLERNRVKPEGMSATDWLVSFIERQSKWDKGRKLNGTGIEALSTKDLWPTDDGKGEALRKAMLEAVRVYKASPGGNYDWMRATEQGRDPFAPEAAAEGGKDAEPAQFALRGMSAEQRAENFRRWSNDAPMVSSAAANTYPFKSGKKVVLEAFHGAKRPDRIGTVFKRSRATSGPMAFFTSAPDLASSYAQGKDDTSLNLEETPFETWFKYKPPGERSQVDIVRAWYRLDEETKAKIAALAPRIQHDDTAENIVLGPEGNTRGNGGYDIREARGNPLKALVTAWLESGSIFNSEHEFVDVLRLAGFPVKDVTYDSPNAEYPSVFKVFVFMQKPLVTSDIPQEVRDALKAAAKRDRSRAQQGGVDMWDKNTRTLREWVENFSEREATDAAYVWTSIPDKVTEVFKSLGYDGIIDWSGKGGGHQHPVYIPFSETQVKSATGNKGTFDGGKKDIRYSIRDQQEDQSLSYEEVEQIVDELTAKWQNRPDIRVLDSMSEAPPSVLKTYLEQRSQGAKGKIHGFHLKGTVYLVADSMASVEDVQTVLWHESLGHFGLRGWLGDNLKPMLADVILGQRAKVIAKAKAYGLDMNKQADRLMAAEEVLAELAQTRPELGVIRRLVAAIRTWLRDNVPAFAKMKMTDDELIRKFIIPARGFVERGQSPRPTFVIEGENGPETVFSMGENGGMDGWTTHTDEWGTYRKFGDAIDVSNNWKRLASLPDDQRVIFYHATGEGAARAILSEGFDGGKAIWKDSKAGFVYMGGMSNSGSLGTYSARATKPGERSAFVAFAVRKGDVQPDNGTDWKTYLKRYGKDVDSLHGKTARANPSAVVTFAEINQVRAPVEAVTPVAVFDDAGNVVAQADPEDKEIRAQFALGDNHSVTATVYHGTNAEFDKFDAGKEGSGQSMERQVPGFWFAEQENVARLFGKNIKAVQVTLKNPARIKAAKYLQRFMYDGEDGAAYRKALERKGHDGLIIEAEPEYANGRGPAGTTEWGQTNYVAFKPEQIERGDPEDNRVQFSLADTAPDGDDPKGPAIGATLKKMVATDLPHRAGNKLVDYRGLGLQTLGRRQLVDLYTPLLPQLPGYSNLVQRMDADKNEKAADADNLAKKWASLPDERKLADLMHDATLAQIDPSKDLIEGDDETIYGMLREQYQALSKAAKEVYAQARDDYEAHRKDVRDAIKERIERSELQGERKAALLKQMDDEFYKQIKGVYFPLARFGSYVIVVKGADGKVAGVSRAETMTEAETTRAGLLKAYPADKGYTVGKIIKDKEFNAGRDAVSRGFMTELYEVLGEHIEDLSERAQLEDALGQLYLSSLPDLSWAKHGIHRKGTPGFSQDARRAYAQNAFHGARYLAKLRFSDLLTSELTAMQKHVEAKAVVQDYDSVKAQQVVDEMVKRHDSMMNPNTHPLATALTSAGFVFHLGLSPASALVNLSQTGMVAYPLMGAKWGYSQSASELLRASKEAAQGKNDISTTLKGDERRAYDEAVRSGVIDVTQAHDLAGIAQGEDSKVFWKVRPVMRWASFLFHHAERFNRQVTFVAAYRLARSAGASHNKAYEDAVNVTYGGHFDYSASNRPRVMQGNVARVLTLFKQYAQNMIYTLARQSYLAVKAQDPQRRAEARRAISGLLVTHAMAAGVFGLPMVSTLLAAASMVGGSDDEPWDAKVALQNLLADTFGQKPAEVMVHGLSRLTPWDVSGRLGLDKLLLPDVQEGLEGQRLAEAWTTAALGPVASIGVGALRGLQEMGDGRYLRGLEAMVPAAIRGPAKAIRYASEGAMDKTGVAIAEEVSPAAIFGQAMGFSPSDVRNATEGKRAILDHDRRLNERRQHLMQQYAMATQAGDSEGRADVMEEIRAFNKKNPQRQITFMSLQRSMKARAARVERAENGVSLPKNRRDAMEAGRFARAE